MNQPSRTRVLALGALAIAATAASARDDDPMRILTVPGMGEFGPRQVSMFSVGFESVEGFKTGLFTDNSPETWGTLGGPNSPIVTGDNPWMGTQHLRIGKESTLPTNADVGILSPELEAPDDLEKFVFKVGVNINEKFGADYDLFLQSPSSSTAPAGRVKFEFTGRILVLDDGQFVDTGFEYDPGEWRETRVEIDYTSVAGGVAEYYYNDQLIYTDANRFDMSTFATQFGIVSDNFNDGDHGDFDGAMMVYIPAPGVGMPMAAGLLLAARRRRR